MERCKEHCQEHEERTICITRLKTDFKNFNNMVGWGLFILVIVLGVQWTFLYKIDATVDDIAINQAVIASNLKIDLK